MRKKMFVAAMVTMLLFSACGNQTGEAGSKGADSSASADWAGGRSHQGEAGGGGMTAGTLKQGDAKAEVAGMGTEQSGVPETEAGKSLLEEGVVVRQEGSAGTLQVTLPEGFTYDLCPEGSDRLMTGDYGIQFYPEGASEGFIELCYTEFFGVCGTGLEETETELAGDLANIGVYDHHEYWDFVSFRGSNKGIVALSYAVEDWWPEYGGQILEILDTVSLEPVASQAAGPMRTVACGTNAEPSETCGEGSLIEGLGLSLEVVGHTDTEAVLVFCQNGGDPTGELIFGDDFTIEKHGDGEWAEAPVVLEGNAAFHSVAYGIPMDGDREFQVEWEWLYGKLGPGEYRIVKRVEDFRGTADYDSYKIYAYFEIQAG